MNTNWFLNWRNGTTLQIQFLLLVKTFDDIVCRWRPLYFTHLFLVAGMYRRSVAVVVLVEFYFLLNVVCFCSVVCSIRSSFIKSRIFLYKQNHINGNHNGKICWENIMIIHTHFADNINMLEMRELNANKWELVLHYSVYDVISLHILIALHIYKYV